MRILAHVCCGPCSVVVLSKLKDLGLHPTAFFFNPNIQPLAEYMRRREGAGNVADKLGVPIIYADTLPVGEQAFTPEQSPEQSPEQAFTSGETATTYRKDKTLNSLPPAVDPVAWARLMHGREYDRCPTCWNIRLKKTAEIAQKYGFDGITTSLLYSRYQNHEKIKEQGNIAASDGGLQFFYEDFRQSWQEGIDKSKEMGIYRQQYCGCMYSEYARYSRPFNKTLQGQS